MMILDGHPLRIEGGDFRICDGKSSKCGLGGCYKQEFYQKYATEKGESIMRVAVTYENGQIFQHFGHTAEFKVYDVQDGKVIHSEVVDTNGSGHGALAGVLNALKADVLICGGIGGGAQMALSAAGIKLYGGVSGDADAAVEAFVNGTLDYNPDVKCSHHVPDPDHDRRQRPVRRLRGGLRRRVHRMGPEKYQHELGAAGADCSGGVLRRRHHQWPDGHPAEHRSLYCDPGFSVPVAWLRLSAV